MRRSLLSAVAALVLTAALVPPAGAEDLGTGMWDNGVVGTSSYRQATFYTTWDGLKAYAESLPGLGLAKKVPAETDYYDPKFAAR